jgi:pilus assembly protein Flp/PilA
MRAITRGWAILGAALERWTDRDERGASFVEYALLTALIAIVCLAAVTAIGTTTGESLSSTASQLP